MPKKLAHDDYTVGWICPLEVEQIAALEMLDEEHERLPQSPGDHNVYNLGSIAGHNIVIAGLHQPGNSPAAVVVTQMRMTFQNLRFGLLVGIGGGVPTKTDTGIIRLGDVVVSKPVGGHSGAVQYDHGKAKHGHFERVGSLAPPPVVLLNAAQDLAVKRARAHEDPIGRNIKRIDTSIQGLRRYKYPGPGEDNLYRPDYLHLRPGVSCDECGCDPSQRIQRTTHDDEDDQSRVVVHRGIIASGELVLKNAILRDQLAHDGLLCFEMEAAGAMADFPCMVVRGISDYCDSHKNDQWHGYAAAVAAAYARELFFHVPEDPKSSLPWELLQQAKQQDFGETALREKRIEILKLLNTTPYRDRKDRNPDRIQGTCEWFTEHELFLDWQQAKTSRLLWVSADPGCGKSVLAKYLVDSVLLTTASRATCYFFFKDDFEDQRGVVGALCCILHQLFMQKRTLLSERILERFEISGEKFDRSFSELWDILLSIAEDPNAGEIVCILDAIDECEDQGRTQLVQALCKLYGTRTNFNLKFLLTSRPYGGIRRDFQSLEIPGMPIIHLSGENDTEMEKISKEIDIFIKARVQGIGAKLKLTTEEEGLLLEGLMRVPNRTYLWVHLTLDLIESDPDIDKYGIVKATHNLPKTIDEAYDRILCKSRNFTEAKKLLHIVVAAERPLTLKEMSLALALRKYHKSYTDVDLLPEDRFRENVRDLCGLFITVNDSRIYLLHQTSKEFLVQIAFTVPPQHIKYDGLEWKESLRPQVSHGILAEICIQRLLFAECESHPVKKDGMSSQYTDSHVFLDYSAKHWAAHLQDSYGENDIATDLILKLCDAKSNRCLTWLRIYWTSTNTDFPENFNDLMIASYFGLTALVKQKLRRGDIDLDSKDSTYGRSALSWAAENGSYAIVKLLLKAGTSSLKRIMSFRKGAKVDSTDRYGRTPLSYAAWNGHVAVVKLLLKSGARVDTMDEIGGTPLSYAVVNGHDTVVNLLLNKETNIDSEDNISKTLMFEAAKKRHDAVVKLLLEKGVDLEEKDSSDRTPLSWAAGNGHETVVKLLLQEGADIESKDTSHRTPLSRAAENGHVTVVKLLLENGAQFEYKDIAAQNPLLRAAINGRKAVVGLLLEKGAALEVKDQFDRTPLIWAARNGYDLVVKLLLEKGAVVEFQDSFGQSPLLWAAKNGRDAVVELLLSKNGDSESKDKTGRTPLSWAAGDGHKEVVEVLLKKGADSESKDQYGKTPLSWAIENGDEQMVRLFLGKDADNPDSPELKRVRQIKQENATVAECKMLLLGTSESGKSTIMKQMKVLYANSYTEEERTLYRLTVFRNLIDSVQALIKAMYSFDLKPMTQENQEYSSFLLEYRLNPNPKTLLDTKVGDAISSLWKDEVIPKVMERQKEFYLMDPAPYFFDEVKRISAGNYIPTVDDVLRARTKTTGIYETRQRIGNLRIHLFDVGGLRSERKKWIHCFENVTAISFFVALSEYDQVLLEESGQNRMMESLVLFDSVVNSRWFTRTFIVLFLNKFDLFKKKLSYSPFADYFPDCTAGTDANAAAKYLLWRFNQLNRAQLTLYPHLIQATDSTNIRLVFDAVKETIIRISLKDSKVL